MEERSGAGILVLATSDDIEQAYAGATMLGRPHVEDVHVTLPWLAEDERRSASRSLRRHHNDCGCRAGELALALAGLFVWLAPGMLHVHRPGWPGIVILLVLTAIGGKLIGLVLSRRRFRLGLRRLSAGARIKETGGGHHGSNPVP